MIKLNWTKAVLVLITAMASWQVGMRWSFFTIVYGGSMEPTLHSGQLLRVHHFMPHEVPRGTVVLVERFGLPPLIKRVVGLPNETVSFKLGEVFINGRMLREPYIPEQLTTFSWNQERIHLGGDQYLVLGDNRPASQDGRDYGPVSRWQIVGAIEVASSPVEFLSEPRYRIITAAKSISRISVLPPSPRSATMASAVALGLR